MLHLLWSGPTQHPFALCWRLGSDFPWGIATLFLRGQQVSCPSSGLDLWPRSGQSELPTSLTTVIGSGMDT